MAILITGAAGFIGGHLVDLLHETTDEEIVGLDNFNDYYDPALKRHTAARLAKLARFKMVEGDFCDAEICDQVMTHHGVRRIVHLGAYAGVRYSVAAPRVYQQVNVGGTLNLLESARRHPIQRMLLVSSSTVYGTGAEIPFQEDAVLGVPASPYGATKRAAELMGLTYHQLHGVPVVCLRPFSVYGPRLRPDLALTIFTRAVFQGDSFPLYGDGTIRRDFTHVADICRGLAAALYRDGVVGETFNLGHSHPIEMRQVIRLIENALGKTANIDRRPARPEDLPVTYADLTKSRRLLGYETTIDADQGIPEYCRWFVQWQTQRT